MILRILGIIVTFVVAWVLGNGYGAAKARQRKIRITKEELKFIDNRPIK